MSAFENAKRFFHACDSLEGWAGCRQYVAPSAGFKAQADPLTDIDTVEGYTQWMAAFGNDVVPGCSYDLHSQSWDEETRTATFFATFVGVHSGDGGPVPPTGKETNSHYAYVLQMNSDDLVAAMVKVWNASWAMRQLGWE